MKKVKNQIMNDEFIAKVKADADKNMARIKKNCDELHGKYVEKAELFKKVSELLKF
jgi:hypothetical protein